MDVQPRPEYPRMQFRRGEGSWINLNGEWSLRFDHSKSGIARRVYERPEEFDRKILVPFCPESSLSGIGETDFIESLFYARTIAIPPQWDGRRILLHFGAVDYQATVWLDGVETGRHRGGSSSFTVDLTGFARPGTEQTLAVHALDELRGGMQSGGKQSFRPESFGCFYTRTTGIWQTVWLEAVHPAGLRSCRITPLFDDGAFALDPLFYRESRGHHIRATLYSEGRAVDSAESAAFSGTRLRLETSRPRAWSPEDPFLYDLLLEVLDASGRVIDRVESYAGLRKIHIEGDRLYLNNRPLFLRLALDQGFYPDGVWTAPTDEALRRDIELGLSAGFNGARLHEKVFEERFHYWADRLGYLTWGEYPNWSMKFYRPESCARLLEEWREVVTRDRNHPSIICWTPLNETCTPEPQWLQSEFRDPGALESYRLFVAGLYDLTRELDPTRPVNDASGFLHVKTDLWSVHPYCRDAAEFRQTIRPANGGVLVHSPEYETGYGGQPYVIDEFGGFKFDAGQCGGWGYHDLTLRTPEELCARIAGQVDVMLTDPGIAGYCYTQLYDVEQECNGLYRYDRAPKLPPEQLRAIFARIPENRELPQPVPAVS